MPPGRGPPARPAPRPKRSSWSSRPTPGRLPARPARSGCGMSSMGSSSICQKPSTEPTEVEVHMATPQPTNTLATKAAPVTNYTIASFDDVPANLEAARATAYSTPLERLDVANPKLFHSDLIGPYFE